MSADIISMGGDLEGGSSAPDTGTDSAGGDFGLSGLEQAIESTSGAQEGGQGGQAAPPPASSSPAGYQRADFTERRTGYSKFQGGWKSREVQRQQQMEGYRLEREGMAQQMGQIAQLLQQQAALTQKPGEQEPPPDPWTDFPAFQAWQAKQQDAALDSRLKPLMDYFQQSKAQEQAAAQQQFHSQQQQEHISRTTSLLQDSHASYAQQFPEQAHGSEERITFGLEALTSVFSNGLGWTQDGANLAGKVTLAVAQYAQAGGENPAAAVDAFYTNLIQEVGESIRGHYAALGYDLPAIMPVTPGGNSWDGGQQQIDPALLQQRQGDPAARENARLQAVHQRSQGVASPRPRQPARGNNAQPQSRAHALANDYRQANRPVDWDAVQRQATAEAGGNKTMALRIMQAIPR